MVNYQIIFSRFIGLFEKLLSSEKNCPALFSVGNVFLSVLGVFDYYTRWCAKSRVFV